ncbi:MULTISPECIES: nickel-dependent lactate racemase [Proteiniphilum]|jgi:nickel-dependent lactate racemase|uniref:nickel-dependent lactate racemase n=2 Tax=Dysgonomonadaceae TaxID=2005520 RepID=UPI001EEB3CC7|nr:MULTISPECIES: nickel-dependent lactate racemase [Proteiniphilum]ULB34638.1 nickel-dependent lactate racemase [Proteiniphilum propionicum]
MKKEHTKEKTVKVIPVHFGEKLIELRIPEKNLCFSLQRNEFSPPENPGDEIKRALQNPIGTKRLREIVSKNSSVVILADDRTRVTPQKVIIPLILDELHEAGIGNEQIKLVIAYGTHRPMTDKEILERFGQDIIDQIEIKHHDCQGNLVNRGITKRGTRIVVNKDVLNADIRIGVGGVLPHHPVGWSGGAKILLPGVAGTETVHAMHLLGATEQQLGKVLTPCREEMEDFARDVGLHFIVNVIQTDKGELLKAVAGHFIEAHREAVRWGMKIFGSRFTEAADITISSAYPSDFDFTQADKGLFSAEIATKPKGEIILLSPCYEGIAPTHGEEIARLAKYDDTTLFKMLDDNAIEDRFGASECMYLNHIKRNFKATLTMDPILTNLLGFHYLRIDDLQEYLSERINLEKDIQIGIVHNSSEVLPVQE